MFQCFSFFLFGENQKRQLEKRNKKWKMKTDWRRARDKNNELCQVFCEKKKGKGKPIRSDSKKQVTKTNKRNIILKKKLTKKEIGKTKSVDSDKNTQKKKMKNRN